MLFTDWEEIEEETVDEEIEDLFPDLELVEIDSAQVNVSSTDPHKNVLLVDDDEFQVKDYGYLLAANGLHVTYAFDADQALKLMYLLRSQFSIVILDIRMNHGNFLTSEETSLGMRTGITLATWSETLVPDAFIVGLSNTSDTLDQEWFRACHMYCAKSEYSPSALARVVKRILIEQEQGNILDESVLQQIGQEVIAKSRLTSGHNNDSVELDLEFLVASSKEHVINIYTEKEIQVDNRKTIHIGAHANVSAPITVADSIESSFNTVAQSQQPDEIKHLFEQLMKEVAEASDKLPTTEAEELSQNIEILGNELAKEKPLKRWYEFSLNGIKEAANAVGEAGLPIIKTVGRLLPALAALFP